MQIALNALSLSAFYTCFALGLALVFGVMRIINFAHGDFYMIGAYAAWLCITLLAPMLGTVPAYLIGCLAAVFVLGVLGLALNAAIVRPLADRPLAIFVATLALSYVLQTVVVQVFGPGGQSVGTPLRGVLRVEGAVLPWQRVTVIGVAAIVVVLLWLFLQRTRTGRAIRAVSQNERGALLQGVNIRAVGALTLALGSLIAGGAGAAMAPIAGVNPFMGVDALWKAFIIIIVGGIGSIWGAVAAAILFGSFDTLISSLGQGRFLALSDAVVMLAVLAVKPSGLFGESD